MKQERLLYLFLIFENLCYIYFEPHETICKLPWQTAKLEKLQTTLWDGVFVLGPFA